MLLTQGYQQQKSARPPNIAQEEFVHVSGINEYSVAPPLRDVS